MTALTQANRPYFLFNHSVSQLTTGGSGDSIEAKTWESNAYVSIKAGGAPDGIESAILSKNKTTKKIQGGMSFCTDLSVLCVYVYDGGRMYGPYKICDTDSVYHGWD